MSKIFTTIVAAGAYVLGAKAGRERYDQICAQTRRLRRDPRVQQTASDVAEVVKKKAAATAEAVKGGGNDTAERAEDKLTKATAQTGDAKHPEEPDLQGSLHGASASANSTL